MVKKKQAIDIDVDWSVLPNIIPIMFPLVKNSLLALGYQRNFEILCKRYGLEGNNTYTLQEIGSFLGITRERVRQLEENAEEVVRKILCGQQAKINVPAELINEVGDLSATITAIGPLVTEEELIKTFISKYQHRPQKTEISAILLLLSILGFELLPDKPPRPNALTKSAWITTSEFDRQNFYEARRKADEILIETVAPLSFFDLVVKVNKGKKKPISQSTIRLAIKTMAYVEVVGEDCYQVSFACLKSLADKAYRILYEHKTPLKLRELHQEINHKLAITQSGATVPMRSISQQLTSEPHRFSISQGSLWGLTEWTDLKKGTTTELILAYFYARKSDASAAEILEYLKKRFPKIPSASVYAYLSQKDKFTRVSANTFVPADWKRKPFILERAPRKVKNETLRQKVQAAVTNYLSVRPSEWVRLEKLKEHITATSNCIGPTFYRYFSEMEQMGLVEKEKRSDGVYCKIRAAVNTTNRPETSADNWLPIILAGESKTVEFKRAAKWNDYDQKADGNMVYKIVTEVAGFLNADFPGQIFIGVDDKTHELLGLENDFREVDKKKPNRDGYSLFLSNTISSKLGFDLGSCFDIEYQNIQNKEVCCIFVRPSPRIVYYDGNLYLRVNSQTKQLNALDAIAYEKNRQSRIGGKV